MRLDRKLRIRRRKWGPLGANLKSINNLMVPGTHPKDDEIIIDFIHAPKGRAAIPLSALLTFIILILVLSSTVGLLFTYSYFLSKPTEDRRMND